MPLVLWESNDSMRQMHTIWSGISPIFPSGVNLFADKWEVYITGKHDPFQRRITRIMLASGLNYLAWNASPVTTSGLYAKMAHFVNEYAGGMHLLSVYADMDDSGRLYTSNYPEYYNTWTERIPITSGYITDIIFPDIPDAPEFVLSVAGSDSAHVWIIMADSFELWNRYITNWSGMAPASVVDLECVRWK